MTEEKDGPKGPKGATGPIGALLSCGPRGLCKRDPSNASLGEDAYIIVYKDVKRITEICELPVDTLNNMRKRLIDVKLECIPKDIREKYDLE